MICVWYVYGMLYVYGMCWYVYGMLYEYGMCVVLVGKLAKNSVIYYKHCVSTNKNVCTNITHQYDQQGCSLEDRVAQVPGNILHSAERLHNTPPDLH